MEKERDEKKYLQWNHLIEKGKIIDAKGDIITQYDESAIKTIESILAHKKSVKEKLGYLADELKKRAEQHDDSKLKPPEIEWLIEMDKEPKIKYGSPEYFEKQKRWKKFFDHHYENNDHHPDHFPLGINDMDLVEICEMCCDIISYFDKMTVDQAIDTVNNQADRFGVNEQLSYIIKNTLLNYFSWFGPIAPNYVSKKSHSKNIENPTEPTT